MLFETLPYTIHDVFTDTKLAGNPLAIVHLPSPNTLTQAQKLAITSEFNLSETVFLHPRTQDTPEWRADIFTVGHEVPFAGHPTIGSACFIASQDETLSGATLLTKAGPIPLTFTRDGGKALSAEASIPHNVHEHGELLQISDIKTLQPALKDSEGLQAGVLFSIVHGLSFAIIRLRSKVVLEKLGAAWGQTPKDFVKLDEGWDEGLVGAYFYVVDEQRSSGAMVFVDVRMFLGSMEDPATGSAASALACHLALQMFRKDGVREMQLDIVQGMTMGRKSALGVKVRLDGEGKIESVHLKGSSVQIMKGELFL